jgi:hypothetical protein
VSALADDDVIGRALAFMLRHAPRPERLRFSQSGGRGLSVLRLTDEELARRIAIGRYLCDGNLTPPSRMSSEERTRLYDYQHLLYAERSRRATAGGERR